MFCVAIGRSSEAVIPSFVTRGGELFDCLDLLSLPSFSEWTVANYSLFPATLWGKLMTAAADFCF